MINSCDKQTMKSASVKSDLSLHSQRVLDSDTDMELLSRSQYYSGFFTDHQHLCNNDTIRGDFDDVDIPFPRVVEGCEDISDSGFCSSDSESSSSDREDSKPTSLNTNKKRSVYFVPSASSTMIECNKTPVKPARKISIEHTTNFRPRLCSTFIDHTTPRSSDQCPVKQSDSSEEDCSVYTWSIYDKSTSDSSLDDLELSAINGRQLVAKPPMLYKKDSRVRKNAEDLCTSTKALPRTSTKINLHSEVYPVPGCKQPAKKSNKSSSSTQSNDSGSGVIMDKHSLMKKFKKFNKTLQSQDRSSLHTLISL